MIKLAGVDFSYKKNTKLFHALTTDFQPGKIYGLLGRNGAGKTTLLKLICGLLKPNFGTCHLQEYVTHQRNPLFLKDLYFIPESFFLPSITIRQFYQRFYPFYPNFKIDFFHSKIEQFQLKMDQNLKTLSYGEKKRFLLIFAVSTQAKVILFDEPSNGLDLIAQSEIHKLLIEAMSEERTFIISTHHVKEFENLFDQLMIIDQGKILLNHDLSAIQQQFFIELTTTIENQEDILFSQKNPGGYHVLKNITNQQPAQLELDFFFQAVINNPQGINRFLNKKEQNS
ncbi:MAG: ABC transporter ATP-binding protein [Spirochaetes bacterium]|nr:ABC transporter ATP-binding protein [Spirochaetota bacterium]